MTSPEIQSIEDTVLAELNASAKWGSKKNGASTMRVHKTKGALVTRYLYAIRVLIPRKQAHLTILQPVVSDFASNVNIEMKNRSLIHSRGAGRGPRVPSSDPGAAPPGVRLSMTPAVCVLSKTNGNGTKRIVSVSDWGVHDCQIEQREIRNWHWFKWVVLESKRTNRQQC